MAYTPPSGWVERLPQTTEHSFGARALFHARRDCPRVRTTMAGMLPVDRPYSASRCSACAPTGERVSG